MNKKGFSLVELIIVIAIMAILVGVMAPQLIKYIEKTNVSADIQLCDSVKTALEIAISDPVVLNDPSSKAYIDNLLNGTKWQSGDAVGASEYRDLIIETLGYDVFTTTTSRSKMKSTPAKASGVLSCQTIDGHIYVWIDHSDINAKKGDYTASGVSDLSNGVIYVE